MSGLGLSGATKRVADHARSFVELEVQLAMAELKKKAAALGVGIGLTGGAAILGFLALCFALAAAAAGLATALPVWASLLIVCGALVLVGAILGAVGVTMLQDWLKKAVAEGQATVDAYRKM